MKYEFDPKEIAGLRSAIQRAPIKVKEYVGRFLTQGMAEYNKIIIRNPWRMGQSGGGAPTDTGNLRDTHHRKVSAWEAMIYPTAPYAPYVHGLKGFARKRSYQLRPWLDYAQTQADGVIKEKERELLTNIVTNLAQ